MKLLITFAFLLLRTTGFYDFQFTDIQGQTVELSQFSGKKVLIVNTSSDSVLADQYTALEALYQQHKDSLVVIVFPSNSFGQEPGSDSIIQRTLQSQYGVHYIVAAKTPVIGENRPDLFDWLTDGSQNGTMNMPVRGDFQKFLIDEQGNLVGVFTGAIDPQDSSITGMLH